MGLTYATKPLMGDKNTGVTQGYLHGFTPEEQDRLFEQARFLEPFVYAQLDYSDRHDLLEIGCGVGAQTDVLLRRFPELKITGIDASPIQIERARERHSPALDSGRLELLVGDALHLPFSEPRFDSAFVCWLLEHVRDPIEILKETRRVLLPGALITCSEVMNATFFVHPYSPHTLQYWFAFNDHQWELQGDPFVGAKLGNYLLAAGYSDIVTTPRTFHFDSRKPEQRARFIEYWAKLLLSGAPGLLEAGKVTPALVEGMKDELARLKNDPDAVFFYSFMQAQAVNGRCWGTGFAAQDSGEGRALDSLSVFGVSLNAKSAGSRSE